MGGNVLEDLSKEVSWYSVAFVKVRSQKGREIPSLQGSGVLVRHGDYHGILTAAHVAAELVKLDFIGLVYSEAPIQIAYKREVFDIRTIAYDRGNTHGPDLAIVTPAIKLLNDLKAKMSFVNLHHCPRPVDMARSDSLAPAWSIMGAVQELSCNEGENRDLRAMFMSYCCATPTFQTRNGHDSFELRAEYSEGTDTPGSFKGVSGGGLWRAVLEREGHEARICDHPRLMGITFYQEGMSDGARIIRGHGPRSVYAMVPEFLAGRGI